MGVAHASYMNNQPIYQYGIDFQVQNRREMRSCLFIPNKVLYVVIFYDTQFYVGTYYNYYMIYNLLCGETKMFNEIFKI